MAIGNNVLAFLAGAGRGYMKQSELEEENAWRQEQRDAWRQEQSDKKAERDAYTKAFEPVEVQQWSGGPQAVAALQDPLMGPKPDEQPRSLDFNAPMAYQAGSQIIGSQSEAQKAADAMNAPEAQMARAAQNLRSSGLHKTAIELEHDARKRKMEIMQEADADWRRGLNGAMLGGPDSVVDFVNKNGGAHLNGRTIKAVHSPDGDTFTLFSVDPDGQERQLSEALPNNEIGMTSVGYALDRLVDPAKRMEYADQQRKAAQDAQYKEREVVAKEATAAAQVAQVNSKIKERDEKGVNPEKPLPVPAVKLQNELIGEIGSLAGINADLGGIAQQVEAGELTLGPVQNYMSDLKNKTGIGVDDNSRRYQSFVATLEKLRNDSLRLNKGVQTEGDAVRAWNELMANTKDPVYVAARIKEIQAINQRASILKRQQNDLMRSNYGYEPMDYSQYTGVGSAIGAGNRAPAARTQPPTSAIEAEMRRRGIAQ